MKTYYQWIIALSVVLAGIQSVLAQVTDINGKTYKTVVIGNQEWMAEDLAVTKYRNGDSIIFIKSDKESYYSPSKYGEQWNSTRSGSYCITAQSPRDCYITNGRKSWYLYNWYAVNDNRGLAPEGWHVPAKADWIILIDYLGGLDAAGKILKSISGWDIKYASNGNNTSGFSALPTGFRTETGVYMGNCQYAWYWMADAEGDFYAWCLQLGYQVENYSGLVIGTEYRQCGMAIRCVKNK